MSLLTEDLQVSKGFLIKSSIHNYEVNFVDNYILSLKEKIKTGDILIIDKKVFNLYQEDLGYIVNKYKTIYLEPSENQKSYLGMAPIIEELIQNGFKKNNCLIAIGGGITQDVVAFLSQNMFRGVDWLFLPTTLLAQADSCIGGKSSINFGEYKNQLGNFYPPNEIIVETNFLQTLSHLDIRSGLGEMMHFFVLSSEKDFNFIKTNYTKSLTDFDTLKKLIFRSLEIKKKTIEIDEFDKKERQVFNYGHSFGHAIESITNFRVPHGIAVCHGMDIANYLSYKLGYVDIGFRNKVREMLSLNWKKDELGQIDIDKFVGALKKDKKNVANEVRVILTRGFGQMFKASIDVEGDARKYLVEYFKNEAI